MLSSNSDTTSEMKSGSRWALVWRPAHPDPERAVGDIAIDRVPKTDSVTVYHAVPLCRQSAGLGPRRASPASDRPVFSMPDQAGRAFGPTPSRPVAAANSDATCARPNGRVPTAWLSIRAGRERKRWPRTRCSPRTSPIRRANSAGSVWLSHRAHRLTRRRTVWSSWASRFSNQCCRRSAATRCGAGSRHIGELDHVRHRCSPGPGVGGSDWWWTDATQLRSGGATGGPAGRVRVADRLAVELPVAPQPPTRRCRPLHLRRPVSVFFSPARGARLLGGARREHRSRSSGRSA